MSTTDITEAADAERDLLGLALRVPWVLTDVDVIEEDFWSDGHRALWALLRSQQLSGRAHTEMGLLLDFKARERLVEVAEMCNARSPEALLGMLTGREGAEATVYLSALVASVKRAGQLRRMRTVMHQRADEIDAAKVYDLMEWWAAFIAEGTAALDGSDTGTMSLDLVMDPVSARFAEEARGERRAYIPTGIRAIDENRDFLGLSSEGVTLILAASSMGKTSLINRLALGMGQLGRGVMLHGTETDAKRRGRDLAFSLAGVDARAWAHWTAAYAEFKTDNQRREVEAMHARIARAERALAQLPIEVSGSGRNVEQVVGAARMLHGRGAIEVLIVDYLQDLAPVRGNGMRLSERTAQIGHSMACLKQVAADLGIPVVVAAQVSGEKAGVTGDPRPQMWDCQWSSQAHQDAEEVYALFRGDYYRERFSPEQWQAMAEKGGFNPGREETIELIGRKRRVGVLRSLELGFHGPTKWVADRPMALSVDGLAEVAK